MRRSLGIAVLLILFTTEAQAIDAWHSNTDFVQGICSYQLTFDAQDVFFNSESGVEKLILSVDAFDEKGNRLESGTVTTGAFADSEATRTTVGYFEGDCETKSLVIWKASALIDGKEYDLLNEVGGLTILESPLKEPIGLSIRR